MRYSIMAIGTQNHRGRLRRMKILKGTIDRTDSWNDRGVALAEDFDDL